MSLCCPCVWVFEREGWMLGFERGWMRRRVFLAAEPHIRVCLIEWMCVFVCVHTFGLVSPASCSGEGNMLVRMSIFCHIRIDGLELWSERQWGREWGEKSKRTNQERERERGRERAEGREGVKTLGERMEWISNLAFLLLALASRSDHMHASSP